MTRVCRGCHAGYKPSSFKNKNHTTKDEYNLYWTNDEWHLPSLNPNKDNMIGFCHFCDRDNPVWYKESTK